MHKLWEFWLRSTGFSNKFWFITFLSVLMNNYTANMNHRKSNLTKLNVTLLNLNFKTTRTTEVNVKVGKKTDSAPWQKNKQYDWMQQMGRSSLHQSQTCIIDALLGLSSEHSHVSNAQDLADKFQLNPLIFFFSKSIIRFIHHHFFSFSIAVWCKNVPIFFVSKTTTILISAQKKKSSNNTIYETFIQCNITKKHSGNTQ